MLNALKSSNDYICLWFVSYCFIIDTIHIAANEINYSQIIKNFYLQAGGSSGSLLKDIVPKFTRTKTHCQDIMSLRRYSKSCIPEYDVGWSSYAILILLILIIFILLKLQLIMLKRKTIFNEIIYYNRKSLLIYAIFL